LEVQFHNKELKKLYCTKKSKKLKLPGNVIINFFKAVAKLEGARDIYELWNLRSLKFKKLQGSESVYAVRLDIKYRLKMSIEWTNEELTVGIIGLEEISNHYGD